VNTDTDIPRETVTAAPVGIRSLISPSFELFIALRYLFARRRQAFISLISFVSTLGVAVGVLALVVALALMTGLQGEVRDRIVGSAAHVYVWKVGEGGVNDYPAEAAKLKAIPRVIGAAPAVLGKALVTTDRGEAFITVKGIDPALEPQVTDIARAVEHGSIGTLAGREGGESGLAGIAIGHDLAAQLGANIGDGVTLLTPQGTLSPLGVMPRTRRLEVVAIFRLGLFEFDSAYGFVALPIAQRLFARESVDFIQLKVDDIYRAPQVAEAIPERLGATYLTQDWAEMNRSLFSALWLEKMAISITIGLIVMVAALNIIASLVLLVMEKSRDIAILKTMGASARSITAIFMLQGLIIGLVGTAVGAIGGYAIAWILDRYEVIRVPMDVYQVSHVPFVVEPLDFTLVVVAAVLICFGATIYPSRQAALLDPVQALRYQ
jgi:lipoprotein-releasing system permease protein